LGFFVFCLDFEGCSDPHGVTSGNGTVSHGAVSLCTLAACDNSPHGACWHPRAVAAALANLRYLTRHKSRLLKNAAELGQYFLSRLSQMSFKGKATVRGMGLALGVEVKNKTYASKIGDTCRENGLLISAEEDILMLFPALTITRQTAERGLDIFERSLRSL
jgi:4-aminobutyrate aminotransferase-like enzyme